MIKFQKFPTNREHIQKSFIDLILDENLPLSLSLSIHQNWMLDRPTHPIICTTQVYKAALKSHMISGFLF